MAASYRLYTRRWLMLATLFSLNLSGGMMWLSFSPIPNYTAAFYSITVEDVSMFSILYSATSLVAGFGSILVLDICGLKVALYFGAICNFIGSIIRWISTMSPILCSHDYSHGGYMVAMIGQAISAFAQPFLLYAPTKLASFWFGPKERAICTSIATLGNPMGIAMANLISPYAVQDPQHLPMLMWIYAIPAGASFLLTMVSFWHDQPAIPPAPTASTQNTSLRDFLRGVWNSLHNGSLLGLMLIWGTSAGLFNAVITILPQIICSYGYNNEQSGLWAALTIFTGVIGATIASFVLDYTKMFKEIGVVSFGMAALCFVWFVEVYRLYDQSVNVLLSLCVFGFFAFPLVPVCMELGVEITYPTAEAISSGLLWSSVQMASVLLVILSNILQTDLPEELVSRSRCHLDILSASSCIIVNSTSPDASLEHPQDMTTVMVVYMCLVAAVFLYMVLLFNPQYKRSEADHNSELHYKALKPVECFQAEYSVSKVEQNPTNSHCTNSDQTVETTYQTADSYSTYLQTSESDECTNNSSLST